MNSRRTGISYKPSDVLYLWLLTQPKQPILIGELHLVRTTRGVSLRYAPEWLQRGFALSEDLPLIDEELIPTESGIASGAVDDARPDRWGERVIRFLDKPPRLSLLEYLYFAGDDRFGALGVSTSGTEYLPRQLGPLPALGDTDTIHELIRRVQANEPVPEEQKRLISPGVTLGGARPKALLDIAGEQWVIKFDDGEPADTPLVEHASMLLAQKANIRVAATKAVRLIHGHAVIIKRFDHATSPQQPSVLDIQSLRSCCGDVAWSKAIKTCVTCTSCFVAWCSTFSSITPTITKRITRWSLPMLSNTDCHRHTMCCLPARRSAFNRCASARTKQIRRSPMHYRWRRCLL